ncbi:hypothetical protein ABLE91_27965 [Aquabacter sp. CN5-332]|uniref:hypothetical protein n=1 Tax=Aquabacter sp. CN5-332 TaxID=3156608 RepID=UPI0032B455D6
MARRPRLSRRRPVLAAPGAAGGWHRAADQSLLFLAVSAGHDVELRLGDAATVGTAQGIAEVVTLCFVRNFNAGAPELERGP